jgi:hypothetical protein
VVLYFGGFGVLLYFFDTDTPGERVVAMLKGDLHFRFPQFLQYGGPAQLQRRKKRKKKKARNLVLHSSAFAFF